VLAGERIHDDRARAARAQLSTTFTLEAQRGDPVHRREQARFLLDVEHRASEALSAAEGNWQVQREPEDALILLRAAAAAHRPDAAQIVLRFIAEHRLEDARLERYRREVP
jgi:hypothetical protein